MYKKIFLVAVVVFTQSVAIGGGLQKYDFKNRNQTLVDNYGKGFDNLYGLRNFRLVFDGIVYRGGANNAYHKSKKRHNSNPLPEDGLENLCKEGFDTAVYLYQKNFSRAKKSISCEDRLGKSNILTYKQLDPQNSLEMKEILKIVKDKIEGNFQKPVYLHCWNGWHASGLASAISLRQFCGWTGKKALEYWKANAVNSNHRAYSKIRQKILGFTPYKELEISKSKASTICR